MNVFSREFLALHLPPPPFWLATFGVISFWTFIGMDPSDIEAEEDDFVRF